MDCISFLKKGARVLDKEALNLPKFAFLYNQSFYLTFNQK